MALIKVCDSPSCRPPKIALILPTEVLSAVPYVTALVMLVVQKGLVELLIPGSCVPVFIVKVLGSVREVRFEQLANKFVISVLVLVVKPDESVSEESVVQP